MAEVYTNAALVIAATGAESSTDGCFWDRCVPPATRLTYTDEAGLEHSLYARECQPPRPARGPDRRAWHHGWTNPKGNRLGTRGWCFQEEVLARRTLQYSRDDLLWECMETVTCECRPFHSRIFATNSFLELGLQKDISGVDDKGTKSPAAKVFRSWSNAVVGYSSRELSFCTDRLPAISALASIVHNATGDTYYAGLWKSRLPLELLWERNSNTSSRPAQYCAPSWSWASVCGSISRASTDFESLTPAFDMVLIQASLSGSNPFGRVTDGRLELDCFLIPSRIAIKTQPPAVSGIGTWHAHVIVEGSEEDNPPILPFTLDVGLNVPGAQDLEVNEIETFFLMIIGTAEASVSWPMTDWKYPLNHAFLVLAQIADKGSVYPTFRRVGSCQSMAISTRAAAEGAAVALRLKELVTTMVEQRMAGSKDHIVLQ